MPKPATTERPSNQPKTGLWSVMFIDLVGSTELKYKEGDGVVAQIITELFEIIRADTVGEKQIKFTGDGAMVIFEKERDGALHALEAAERIVQKVDSTNLRFEYPRIHIRIGIATGECYEVNKVGGTELSGKAADLAARLQSEAEIDSIMVDEATKTSSGQPPHRFIKCTRRLSLKGVPPPAPEKPEEFYFFKAERFLKPPKQEHYSKGLLALYPDRTSLYRDLSAVRLINLAKPGSTVLVAGRTLKYWAALGAEIRSTIREKGTRFHLVISSEGLVNSAEIHRYLEEEQINELRRDLPQSRNYFLDLVEEMAAEGRGEHFRLRETDYLILDGITCAEITPPGDKSSDGKLITLQDINAAPGEDKATFLLACRCNDEREVGEDSCMAHGLYKRTNLIFEKADECQRTAETSPVQRILRQYSEGVAARNNSPSKYASHIKGYFPLVKEGRLGEIPAPVCVQMQVSSTCSTKCRMCDHWQQENDKKLPEQLTSEQWGKVFDDVAKFGVRSVIFSGGEPLRRPDIGGLLKSAHDRGLRIGLLTNGTMEEPDAEKRREVIASIRSHVEWVAISIDGTPDEDEGIRNPTIKERFARLKEFCTDLSGGPTLSATVTLQKENIRMNLKRVIEFITDEDKLNIPRVNFKVVTGSKKALNRDPNFLLKAEDLEDMIKRILWSNPLTQKDNNNLDYLRRCFASGVFNVADAGEGAPLHSFYEASGSRCHTPFLFSLIDGDGSVYPCCHLFRDNHSYDRKTEVYRNNHRMGNVKDKDFKFSEVWNGDAYQRERQRLERIDPSKPSFEPCGECTRYCQHNRVLTQIYREYEKDDGALDALADDNPRNDPVWF